jgi:hypothetical protein
VLTDIQLGYLAGIIDGEGSISLTGYPYKPFAMRPRVQIANTDLSMLTTIQGWVGGYVYSRPVRIPGRKQVFGLAFQSRADILELLRIVEPYLIIKKAQAQLLIAWCLCDNSNNGRFLEIMKVLNKTGGA